jgi:signal transduction histidine kinase
MNEYLRLSYWVITLCYILIHIVGGALGNFLSQSNVFFWPPVGFSLSLLILYGYRFWPAILLGGVIQALLTGASLPAALLFGVGSTVGPLTTLYILKNFIHFNNRMEKLRDILGLIFIALPISSSLVSTIITTARFFNHTVAPATYFMSWMNIWISDLLSNIIVAIPIILWFSQPIHINKLTKKRVFESIGLAVTTLVLGVLLFTNLFELASPKTYLAFFPIIWAALRFGPRETTTILLYFCSLAVWGTSQRSGPFFVGNTMESLIYLRSFMLIYAITSLILASSIHERIEFEKRKNSFIQIASHELKTPLTSLKMITQLMEKDIKNKRKKEQFETMNQQIDKLTDITTTLLDLSKIQSGKLELAMQVVPLQMIIESAINTVHYVGIKHKIIVRNTIPDNVYADKARIGQVLINLINNAIKHSPNADKVVINVIKKGNMAQVSVQDFGMGISRERLGRIFERFYQVSEGKMLEGLGLGLFISSEIIKQHEGKIWATSEPGKGSTFFFTLPVRRGVRG